MEPFSANQPYQPKLVLIEIFQKKWKSLVFSAKRGQNDFLNCDLAKQSLFWGFTDLYNPIFAYFRPLFAVFQPNLHEN